MHRGGRNPVKFPENCPCSSAATYKTELFSLRRFWQPQRLDSPGGLQENLTVVIIPGKLQHIATSVLGQFPRQYQKLVANCFYGGSRIIVRQAQPLKPMDEVVRQKQQLQEGHVGHPTLRRNFIQGKILEEFPERLFRVGSRLVSLPNHPGLQLQVGHESRVGEPAHLQQAQLLGLLGVFGQRSSHHDEAVLRFPSARLKTKLCHRPWIRNRPPKCVSHSASKEKPNVCKPFRISPGRKSRVSAPRNNRPKWTVFGADLKYQNWP